jgi:hypothetical protein
MPLNIEAKQIQRMVSLTLLVQEPLGVGTKLRL